MEKFELEQENYRKRIIELLQRNNIKITITDKTHPELMQVVLWPSNELELEFANAFIDILEDILEILHEKIEYKNIGESQIIDYFVTLINTLKKSGSEEEVMQVYESYMKEPQRAAEIMKDYIIIFSQDPDKASKIIAKRCGYNIKDINDLLKIHNYLEQLTEISNSSINYVKDEKTMRYFIEVSKCFHKIVSPSYTPNKKTKKKDNQLYPNS